MFTDMLKDILFAYGPSGREEQVSEVIKKYAAPYADEVYHDTLGNLIAVKKGVSGKKLMFAAHMDQIGFVVVDIDDKGFLRISNVGGILPPLSVAREVVFENGVRGVTYFETPKTRDNSAVATLPKMYIDIGCDTKEEAEQKVRVGDVCVYAPSFVDMGGRFACGALDNRLCCAAVVEAMKEMKSPHDVYAVFTVQEEVGLRGAGPAAYAIEPDFSVAMDVTLTGDTPEAPKMSVRLGKGAAIKMMDSSVIVPVQVRDFMEKCAEGKGIPFQREVLTAGGTDTSAIQVARSGVLAGCISIPTRYVHSPAETADMKDVEGAVALLKAIAESKELPGA